MPFSNSAHYTYSDYKSFFLWVMANISFNICFELKARLSLHLSKCQNVGNLMPRLIQSKLKGVNPQCHIHQLYYFTRVFCFNMVKFEFSYYQICGYSVQLLCLHKQVDLQYESLDSHFCCHLLSVTICNRFIIIYSVLHAIHMLHLYFKCVRTLISVCFVKLLVRSP